MIASSPARTHVELLRLLFSAFDEHNIRYCVLHSFERLPDLPSDLDLAVHPDDYRRFGSVIRSLARGGYPAIHAIHYCIGGDYLVFAWVDSGGAHSVSVDVVRAHRRRGVLLASGEELVEGRRRIKDMWVSAPGVEFAYRLGKQVLKRAFDDRRDDRLRALVFEIGDSECRRLAAAIFGDGWADRVVDACRSADLRSIGPALEARLLKTSRRQRLWVRCQDAVRLLGRWFRPTGLCVSLMGPDGVGKSTLLESLQKQPLGFRHFRLFHWRPMLICRRSQSGPTDRPHNQKPRPALVSMGLVLVHFADYWLGYWARVRPLAGRTGLVLFDRYFDDVLVDPVRYRYGGPLWWPRLMRRWTPRPDLTLILDAPEEVVLARKQECELDQLRAQRKGYRQLADSAPSPTCVVDASEPLDSVLRRSVEAIASRLSQRLAERNSEWFGSEI